MNDLEGEPTPPGTPSGLTLRWSGATDPGRIRDLNEDSWLATGSVFLVADGMGGHSRGEVASRAVVAAFSHLDQDWVTPETVAECLSAAGQEVEALSAYKPAPGSTVVGAARALEAGQPCWLVFNIGDSRAYLLRHGALEQVSVDHSKVQEMKDAGMAIPQVPRNVITRAIGAGSHRAPQADLWLIPALRGDRVLLCSDGLTTEVSDPLIAATLLSAPDPAEAVRRLITAAVCAGGRDNVSAVVVDATEVISARGDAGQTEDTLDETDDVYLTVPDDDTVPKAPFEVFAETSHQEAQA